MSALILDTCGIIWLANGGGDLSGDTLEAIRKADIVYVSARSAQEIGCKAALGKLEPQHHRDPADRIIIATALSKKLSVVTHERRFAEYGVDVLR